MKCPVCANAMTPVQAGPVTVDVCLGGCGGIWFDNFELQKLDQPHEISGAMLIDVQPRADLNIDPAQRRYCPACEDILMMRHFYSPRRQVEVDECPSCGGFWLDAGELALIRQEHADPAAQQAAVEQYLDGMPNRSSGQCAKALRKTSPGHAASIRCSASPARCATRKSGRSEHTFQGCAQSRQFELKASGQEFARNHPRTGEQCFVRHFSQSQTEGSSRDGQTSGPAEHLA